MNLTKWFDEIPTGIDGKPLPTERIFTLEKILSDRFGNNFVIKSVNRLKSKKNTVIHLKVIHEKTEEIDLVAKMFIEGNYENELSILTSSYNHGLAVPAVLDSHDNVILMNFIPGEVVVVRC